MTNVQHPENAQLPFPGFVCGPDVPLQKRFNRLGPPHASVALPVQVMLQSLAPPGAGPDPAARLFPQSKGVSFIQEHGGIAYSTEKNTPCQHI